MTKVTTSASMDWVDIIRVGDRLKSSLTVTGVSSGPSKDNRPSAQVKSEATCWNSYGGLIGKSLGTATMISYSPGDPFLVDRDIYD